MSNEEKYLIMTFPNTPSVMEAEGVLKERFSVTIMPIPRELTASCGLAVRFLDAQEDAVLSYLSENPLRGSLYEMGVEKTDGRHPIRLLLSNS